MKRAQEIKKRYMSASPRFGPLFNSNLSADNFYYNDCSEDFTSADVEMLLELACELDLDRCSKPANQFHLSTVHAMNSLLLLLSSDRSVVDTVAQKIARRCTETLFSSGTIELDIPTIQFHGKILAPQMIILICECGPSAIPYLVTEMRKLLFMQSPISPANQRVGSIIVSEAMCDIIRECYKDIPLAISLTDQFCAPLLEFGRHPTATNDCVKKENSSIFLGKLVDIAILISDEKEVLELCRSGKCQGDDDKHKWIDVLRLFSLEPHPQDELLRVRGNGMDWVIQTWNENHPDRQFPFPDGVVDGPFPGQPGYEVPNRLFRHKYCTGSDGCRKGFFSSGAIKVQENLLVCERCRHTYYCCEDCQREKWYNLIDIESCPPKFRIRPLKRLTKPRLGDELYHRPQCLLVQAYKQWVIIDKQERKAKEMVKKEKVKEEGSTVAIEEEPTVSGCTRESSHVVGGDIPKVQSSKIPGGGLADGDGDGISLKSTEPGAQSGTKCTDTDPYGIFCSEVRPQLKAENPNLKFRALNNLLIAKWGAMDDTAKAPYMKKSVEATKKKKATQKYLPGYDVTMNMIFAEKFRNRQEKHLMKKLINQPRSPSVMFVAPNCIKGVDEERMRTFFDERYVLDDSKLATLAKVKGFDTATRSTLHFSDDEIPLVMVQIMRDPHDFIHSGVGSFEYQNSAGLLTDPSNFDIYSEIEKMHYEHAGGRLGYCFIAKNFSGKEKGETLMSMSIYRREYNVRVHVMMFDNPYMRL